MILGLDHLTFSIFYFFFENQYGINEKILCLLMLTIPVLFQTFYTIFTICGVYVPKRYIVSSLKRFCYLLEIHWELNNWINVYTAKIHQKINYTFSDHIWNYTGQINWIKTIEKCNSPLFKPGQLSISGTEFPTFSFHH